jgi:carboxypeptidase family protein/TonB-dependent receptor-like protein
MPAHNHSGAALISAALLLLSATHVAAQTVEGVLLELSTNRPVTAAAVTLLAEPGTQPAKTTTSANDGHFVVTGPAPGIYRLRVDRPGYRTAVTPAFGLGVGDRVGLTLRLLPDTATLRPVTVTASNRRPAGRLGGFRERAQRRAFGHFISREDIERRHPLLVSDVLRTVPGIEVLPSPTGFGNIIRTTEGCVPNVFLDGVYFPLRGESIDNLISPWELEGVEVYPHITGAPVEFQRVGSSCGSIVLWTREF